jgi:tetratricopeptide (TPR) repeat protein
VYFCEERRADAITPAEEAVILVRVQAAANPAYLPNLAIALNNLGTFYSEVGRHADAITPAEEAVTLYREQAATNPACLPDLAMALNNLGACRLDAGLPWNADAAWASALSALPTSDLKVGLLLQKARGEDPLQAVSDVLTALVLTPSPTGRTMFQAHATCRELRNSDHDLFDSQWQNQLKTSQPPWLFIDDDTLTTTIEWLSTPTHAQARDYHLDHAETLARPETRTALDELALLELDPDLISQHRQLLSLASDRGIHDAYQPLVLAESLSAWLNADVTGKQELLRENRELLLSNEAAELLGQWSTEAPDDTVIEFGTAILSLARDGVEAEVFAALNDHDQFNALLSDLFASGKPQQLLIAAELALSLNPDDPTRASAQLHLAAALALTGHAEAVAEHARTAALLDPNSVNQWVSVLAQQVTAHPELAAVIQALVAPGNR